jgi:DNA-binding FadR family transcriptional regulator
MSFDNCLRFTAMMKISTFCSNIADDRFISGLILKIEQEIADTLNIPRGTISDVVVRFKRRGSVENKPHTGRHHLLDERDTRGLVRLP